MTTRPPVFLALDLETTSFDPYTGSIVEVAAILVSEDLAELGDPFESAVCPDAAAVWNSEALAMHEASNLYPACLTARPWPVVATDLSLWLATRLAGFDPPYLLGFSVHFDRSWLALHAPQILSQLSHRHLDISALLLGAKYFQPSVYEIVHDPHRTRPHRALADCREALATARRIRLAQRLR